MRDDEPLTDVERRLSRRLRPGDDAVERVIAAALGATAPRIARRVPGRRLGARMVGGAILALVIAIAVLWRGTTRAPSRLMISGSGAVVVVSSDDGRRWLIQAQQSSPVRGGYVIAFPQ